MPVPETEALAARLVVGLAGPWPSPAETAWLRHWRPAGVILFSRNVMGAAQLAALCEFLHRLVPGLEIVGDHEGGPVSQLSAAVGRPPAPWALGVLDDPDLTGRVHEETARRCARLGIDRLLAPSADVLVELHNPVIGSRAFGTDRDRVTRQVAAATAGLAAGGVGTCVKHWPGHGGSRTDSHLGLARVADGALAEPFLAGLAAGAGAVMVGHLWPGEAPEDGGLPATLDAERLAAARSLLTSDGGNAARFWADDVTMGALRGAMAELGVQPGADASAGMIEPAELEVGWLRAIAGAGCDRLLIRGIPFGAFPAPGCDGSAEVPRNIAKYAPVPACAVYAEARTRLREAAGLEGFADPQAGLLWLDLTANDRWEAAAGQDPDSPSLAERLERDFAAVRRIEAADVGSFESSERFDRLLVTSHRPLEAGCEAAVWRQGIRPYLADGGRVLTMGHPSLGPDVVDGSGLLPAGGWSGSALYDTMAIDYAD